RHRRNGCPSRDDLSMLRRKRRLGMGNARNPERPEDSNPEDDREERGDTDPLFEDHPEMAPDQSRISTGRMEESGKLSIRRTADTGDLSAESEDGAAHGEPPTKPLRFARNSDFS